MKLDEFRCDRCGKCSETCECFHVESRPPTDSEMLDWLLTERRTVKSHIGGSGMVYHFKSRGEITAAMQAEKGKR